MTATAQRNAGAGGEGAVRPLDQPMLAALYARLADLYAQLQQAHGTVAAVYGQRAGTAAVTHAGWAVQAADQADRYRYLSTDGLADAIDADAAGAAATVACPVLDDLPRQRCLDHQRQREQFAATNPTRVLLYRACPTCIHRLGAST
jgi:hypothetical protein